MATSVSKLSTILRKSNILSAEEEKVLTHEWAQLQKQYVEYSQLTKTNGMHYRNTVFLLKEQQKYRETQDPLYQGEEHENKLKRALGVFKNKLEAAHNKWAAHEKRHAEVRNILAQSCYRYIYAITKKERANLGSNTPIEDLFNDAVIGALNAIDNFDPSHDRRLVAYVYDRVRQAVEYSNHYDKAVQVSVNAMLDNRRAANLEKEKLIQSGEIIDVNRNQAARAARAAMKPVKRLDTPMSGDSEGRTLAETLDNGQIPDVMTHIDRLEKKELIKTMFRCLTQTEAQILKYSFGLEEGTELQNNEIANKLNISAARVSQFKTSALNKLREHWGDKIKLLN